MCQQKSFTLNSFTFSPSQYLEPPQFSDFASQTEILFSVFLMENQYQYRNPGENYGDPIVIILVDCAALAWLFGGWGGGGGMIQANANGMLMQPTKKRIFLGGLETKHRN